MRASVVALLLAVTSLAACEREPAIVIRFDPADAKPARDAAVVAVAVVDASVVSIADLAPAANLGKLDRHASAECSKDDDCAVTTDGCCDCANGGKLVATTKRAARQSKKDCKDVMCTMVVSTDPSCGKRPACLAGTCGLREARPDERKGPLLHLPAAQ